MLNFQEIRLAPSLGFVVALALMSINSLPAYGQTATPEVRPEAETPVPNEVLPTPVLDPHSLIHPESLESLGGVDTALSNAQVFYRAGDTPRASALCRRILQESPGHTQALQLERRVLITAQRPELLVAINIVETIYFLM